MKEKFLLIIIIFLISIRFFSFQLIELIIWKIIELVLVFYFILFFIHKKLWLQNNLYFKKYVLLFMFLPCISCIVCYLTWEQSIISSAMVTYSVFCWIFYFILHYYKIRPSSLLKLLIVCSIIWTILEIVQQYTYPNFIFYTRGDEIVFGGRPIEIRNGIYRFMITDYIIALFSLFIVWQNCLKKNIALRERLIFILILLMIFIGIYYNQTRQIMIATVIAIFVNIPYLFKNRRVLSMNLFFALILGFALIIIYYSDLLFGELIDLTEDHIEDTDYVRYKAISFFTFDYWNHWINVIFGNGWHISSSPYGEDYMYYHDIMLLSRGDVGIIGIFNAYGLIFIFAYIGYLFLMMRKLWGFLEYYQKLFFISSLIMVFTVVPFYNGHWGTCYYILYSIYFYLIDVTVLSRKSKIKHELP